MTGQMDSMIIKDINKAANEILNDMVSQNFKSFKLKDKENIIIKNPSNFKDLKSQNIDFNMDFEIEDCIKVVMINGILNKNLSDQIPDNYYLI